MSVRISERNVDVPMRQRQEEIVANVNQLFMPDRRQEQECFFRLVVRQRVGRCS